MSSLPTNRFQLGFAQTHAEHKPEPCAFCGHHVAPRRFEPRLLVFGSEGAEASTDPRGLPLGTICPTCLGRDPEGAIAAAARHAELLRWEAEQFEEVAGWLNANTNVRKTWPCFTGISAQEVTEVEATG